MRSADFPSASFSSGRAKEFPLRPVEWSMSIEPIIAVNRFGLGAAPGELAAAAADPRGWLAKQIDGAAPAHPGVRQARQLGRGAEGLSALDRKPRDGAQRHERRVRRAAPRTVEGTFREQLGPIMQEEVAARLAAAASTPAPFRERLVWFWSNHFTVSAEKALVFALVGSFEREAIRPHVGGRFADMLLAATRHPAMILYLDNHLSVRKGWQARGLRASRSTAFPAPTDLNENLAREILELHTLGVNGGYTQADVTEFARVITGWTVRPTMFDLDEASPGFRVRSRTARARTETLARQDLSAGRHRAGRGGAARPRRPSGDRHVRRHQARAPLHRRRAAAGGGRAHRARVPRLRRPPADRLRRAARLPRGLAAAARQAEVADRVRGVVPARAARLARGRAARRSTPRFAAWGSGRSSRRRRRAGPTRPQAWAGGDALWKRIEWAGIVAARIGSRVDPLRLADESYGPALGEPTRRAIERAESRQQGTGALARQPGISAEIGMTTRRQALRLFGGTAALIGLPGLTFAAAPPEPRATDRRLVFMFLRGGMDGLSAVPPYGDPQYAAQRGPLAVAVAGHGRRRARSRRPLRPEPASRGDAQALCRARAHGAARRRVALPRALALRRAEPARERHDQALRPRVRLAQCRARRGRSRSGSTRSGTLGFALGQSMPLVLRGPAQVGSWSPSRLPAPDADLLDRLAALYRDDALLGRSFAVAREAQTMMEGHDPGGMGSRAHASRGACQGGGRDPRQAGRPAGRDHRLRRLGHAHQPAGRVQPADAQPAPARPLGRHAQDDARPGLAAHRGADRHRVRSRGGAERLGRNRSRHRRARPSSPAVPCGAGA